MNNVGLTIEEGVANGATPFRQTSKRNIGLIGQFLRGASFTPTKITNLEEFNNIFGGQSASFFGPAVVKSIFSEAGNAPVTLYIARVTGASAVVANGVAQIGTEGSPTMTCNAGYKGSDDPGSWANGVKVTLYSYGSRTANGFAFIVEGKDGSQEQYTGETLAEIQNAVNRVSKFITVVFSKEIETLKLTPVVGTVTTTTSSNVVTGSGTSFDSALKVGDVLYTSEGMKIGTVAKITNATSLSLVSKASYAVNGAAIKKREDKIYTLTLEGGVDGEVGEADFYATPEGKGLSCFDGYDIQILASTEYHSLSMAKALKSYLSENPTILGAVNLPLNSDEGTAELYFQELSTNDISNLSGYLGWVKIPDDNGNAVLIPAIGPILGAGYIRTPYLQGDFTHIPPAGIDSLFKNVLEVIPARLSRPMVNKLVQQFCCNVIQYVENTGYYVGSSRTYSTNPLYQSIHIRLQTSYYVRHLESIMRYLEQKPNTPELKRSALVDLNVFFKKEYDNGALERSVPFSKAYIGICDQSNNPTGQDRKLLNITCLFIPTECTEAIKLSLQRNDNSLNIQEA